MHNDPTQKAVDRVPKIPADVIGDGARLPDVLNSKSGLVFLFTTYWVFAVPLTIIVSLFFHSWWAAAVIGAFAIALCVGLFMPRIRVMRAFAPGELFLERWPVRRNEQIRIRYQRQINTQLSVTSIEAHLTCCELKVIYRYGAPTVRVEPSRMCCSSRN